MRFLEERNVGFQVGNVRVPIVVGAILFDLMVGEDPSVRPDAACGYVAAEMATAGPVVEGSVGAGAGASVGKFAGPGRAMRGGIGSASVTLPDGLIVAALVAVNPVGDVIDPGTGKIVAGVRTEDGAGFADARQLIRSGVTIGYAPGQNTSIGVVATNATLTKSQSTKVAQMAQDGVARAVVPAHTPLDGDTMFALAVGGYEGDANVLTIGALAADVVTTAILRAVRAATSLEGLPAAADFSPGSR
jgi:L-aminopeptidase/D-esterase-like protein